MEGLKMNHFMAEAVIMIIDKYGLKGVSEGVLEDFYIYFGLGYVFPRFYNENDVKLYSMSLKRYFDDGYEVLEYCRDKLMQERRENG